MTDTKRVVVVFSVNHKLFPEQVDLLNDLFGSSWGILTVPPDGQNLSEISDRAKEVPDGKGGVKLIKTVSPTGWKLIC